MRRLRRGTGVLAAVLLALVARVIVSGPRFATELGGIIVAVLLLASVLLLRHGHRLEPPPASRPTDDFRRVRGR